MRFPFRLACAPLLVLTLGGAAQAQTSFLAELNGGQETPPNASTGTGSGRVLLDLTTSMVTIDVSVSGLSAPISAAHIHTGNVGVPGGITIPLSGGGPSWSQTSGPLTATQLADLRANRWYFNVHTTAFPAGEVRGQITAARARFDALANGVKETPPNGSSGIGVAEFVLNGSRQIQYTVTATGLTTPITAAHIHEGAVGVPGGVIFPLSSTGPGLFGGTTAALTDLQIAKLRSGLYYLNVHSTMFGAGEIRGQLTPAFTDYGTGCAGSSGTPSLDGSGTPIPGQTFSLHVTGGLGGGAGVLLFAVAAAELPLGSGCSLLINTFPVVVPAPIALDAGGNATLPITLTPATPTAWLQLQFAGLDLGAPNGVFSLSNGLGLNVNN